MYTSIESSSSFFNSFSVSTWMTCRPGSWVCSRWSVARSRCTSRSVCSRGTSTRWRRPDEAYSDPVTLTFDLLTRDEDDRTALVVERKVLHVERAVDLDDRREHPQHVTAWRHRPTWPRDVTIACVDTKSRKLPSALPQVSRDNKVKVKVKVKVEVVDTCYNAA